MSMSLRSLSSRLPVFHSRLSSASAAGPRRILAITAGGCAIGALLIGATFIHGSVPTVSRPGRLPSVNPLPGGLNSNPQQDALALRSNNEAAALHLAQGSSFTPQIAPSQLYEPSAIPRPLLTSAPTLALTPAPTLAVPPPAPAKVLAVAAPPPPVAAPAARVVQVQAQGSGKPDQEDLRYRAAVDKLMGGWGNVRSHTDVIIVESDPPNAPDAARGSPSRSSASQAPSASPVSAGGGRQQRVLVPAGRGIYAHTILATSSDANSPVVLQADSGQIAGDRLIGSFSREEERLVIRINRVIHNGQEISVEGIVVAPGTMEASVASSVDQHYASRFILPAAASFVAGLGQAFALSNSSITQSPFGGATALQRLNLGQQFGVAAGAAGARVGQTLDAAAPKGPTIKVDVNSSVGVMFLSNVSTE